ncbi:hypothetical protein [Nocardia sp. IFM 10818]
MTMDSEGPALGGGAEPKVHDSNVRLPADLVTRARDMAAKLGWDHGDLVIHAIEVTQGDGRLAGRLLPAGTVGGDLFEKRAAGRRRASKSTGHTEPFSYSVLTSDLAIFDKLCADFLGVSRNMLISGALHAYLLDEPPAGHEHRASTDAGDAADPTSAGPAATD